MKTKALLLASIAICLIACTKEQPLPESEVAPITVTASVEQTKTSLDGLGVKWTAGDKIYLTDGTNSALYRAMSSAAMTSFEYISGAKEFSGDVYAYYPAGNVQSFDNDSKSFSAIIPTIQVYNHDGFGEGVNPMTAKAKVVNKTLTLSFKNVLAYVKLNICDSDETGKILTGISLTSSADLGGVATVAVGDQGVATTSFTTGYKTIELSGVYNALSLISTPVMIAVPAGSLGQLTITATTAETNGNYTQNKVSSKTLTTERNGIYAYNAMQIKDFANRARIAETPSNCYIVNANTESLIIPLSQALAGWAAINEIDGTSTDMTAKITSGTRTIATRFFDGASGTITLSSINETEMKLTFSGCTNGSNVMVDLINNGEILWSWHIWFTDYKPGANQTSTANGQVHTYQNEAFQEGGLYYGKVIMDRDLGARATGISGTISRPTTEEEANAYFGLFYQFGRKDPFPITGYKVGYSEKNNAVTYGYAAQHPSEYYIGSNDANSWSSTDNAKSDENMTDPWNGVLTMERKLKSKSAFDPCPAGWRVPVDNANYTENVFYGIPNSSIKTDGTNKTGGALIWDAWLPLGGIRYYHTSSLVGRGTHARRWGSAPLNAIGGCVALIQNGYSTPCAEGDVCRRFGSNIRCVHE